MNSINNEPYMDVQSNYRSLDTNRTDIERLKLAGLQKTQDEEELRELNEKFSAFLSKVKQLEVDNQLLEQKIEALRADWDDDVTELSRNKNAELKAAHDAVKKNYDETCSLNGRIKECLLETQFMQEQIEFNRQLNEKASDDLQSLSEQSRNLLEQISLLESNTAQKRNELDEIMSEHAKYGQELRKLNSTFAQHYSERIALQMELPLLSDVVLCMRAISDLKIEQYQNVYDCLLEPTQFYRSELSKAIRGIRRDFTALDNLQRGEIERYYESRLAEARRELEINHRKAQEAKIRERSDVTELATLLEQAKQLNNVKADLEREQSRLTTYAYNLESEVKENSVNRKAEEEECTREIAHLQHEINCVKEELEMLREDNVTLKFEINTYRTLLEGEEYRLEPAHQKHSRWDQPADCYFGENLFADERTRKTSQESSILLRFNETSCDQPGDDCIVIENRGDGDINLSNWYVAQRTEKGFEEILKFDKGLLVAQHGCVKIYEDSRPCGEPPGVVVLRAKKPWIRGKQADPISLHRPDGQMVYQLS